MLHVYINYTDRRTLIIYDLNEFFIPEKYVVFIFLAKNSFFVKCLPEIFLYITTYYLIIVPFH